MSDHGEIDDELARMAIENGGEGNGNDVELDVALSDEEMEEIPNPQQIIFNLNQQNNEGGLQSLDNAAGGEGLPDQRNARAQGLIEAQRHANPGLRNAVAPRRQLLQQGQEYADVAGGRLQPPGLINVAARGGQPWGQFNLPFRGRPGQGNNVDARGRQIRAPIRGQVEGNRVMAGEQPDNQGNHVAGGGQPDDQANPVVGEGQRQGQGNPVAGGGQRQGQGNPTNGQGNNGNQQRSNGGNAAGNVQSHGNRGVWAGQNLRRQAHRFNPYQQDLMNVAELFVNMSHSSANRTRQALAAARQAKDNDQAKEEKNN